MALLTDDIQDKLIKLLVDEGLIEKPVIDAAVKRAADIKSPTRTTSISPPAFRAIDRRAHV